MSQATGSGCVQAIEMTKDWDRRPTWEGASWFWETQEITSWFSLPTWRSGFWALGALSLVLSESMLERRFTCTIEKHLVPPCQSWLSTITQFRLLGLVFLITGMAYVHGCTHELRPCKLQPSKEWHKCNSLLLRSGSWWICRTYNPCEW